VVAGIITVIIAANTEDGLVVDDYYKEGLAINEVIAHDQKAHELGLAAFIDANSETGQIQVSLSSRQKFEVPEEITFRLIHRTRSGEDQITTLNRVGDAADYRGFIKPPIIPGRWTVQIQSQDQWRLKQNFTTRNATNILLNVTS
jgi:hypothetical protein